MLVIGLTGGIASGKTRISDHFGELGIAVIDTDIISRELVEPGNQGYIQIVEKLGESILKADKNIDRAALRRQVFDDASLKSWLESMLHPVIFSAVKRRIERVHSSPYVLVVVPLLFESSFESLVDRILVVDCKRETQLKRLIERDNINRELAEKMLDQQLSNQDRLSRADDVILNDDEEDLTSQIDSLHKQYLELSI